MPQPRFIQIHFLASYPGVLLNRDDAGLAKRLPFGGATRTRVSSQSLKRHWRRADDARSIHALGEEEGIASARSKRAIEERVTKDLRDRVDEETAKAVEDVFVKAVYGSNATDPKKRQALLLGYPELAYLRENAERIAGEAADAKDAKARAEAFFKEGDGKANLKQLRDQNGVVASLDAALFGRMVTSDPRANTDAAIHVAHAFTVHDEEPEQDYFTVVDDLTGRSEDNEDGDTGAAGVFDTELTSGLFYGYVVVDVPLLVSNLSGVRRSEWAADTTERDLPARVVENLIHLVATVSPGAKKGSTAPYSWAEAVLVEMGDRQPRTLANAFRGPIPLRGKETLSARTGAAIKGELDDLDAMYGADEVRLLAARGDIAFDGPECMALDVLAERVAGAVRGAAL